MIYIYSELIYTYQKEQSHREKNEPNKWAVESKVTGIRRARLPNTRRRSRDDRRQSPADDGERRQRWSARLLRISHSSVQVEYEQEQPSERRYRRKMKHRRHHPATSLKIIRID